MFPNKLPQRILHAFLVSSSYIWEFIIATFLTIVGGPYKLQSCSSYSSRTHYPLHSSCVQIYFRITYYKNSPDSYLKARDHIPNSHKTTGKIIVWGQRNLSGRKYLRSTYVLFTTNHLHSIQVKGDLAILKLIWRCVYRASYCNVLMTNEMHSSYNQFYSTVFCLLYMFRTNQIVHHQEHGIIYCITQYNRYNRAGETRLHDCTDCTKLCNTVYYAVLLMMKDLIR